MKTFECYLKRGKEKPLANRHPWVFSGAIDRIDEDCRPGSLVRVLSAEGKFLGTGYINPQSQITIRILSFENETIDSAFFRNRILEAVRVRESCGLPSPQTNAFRLIHSESDFLPGLIVDRYSDALVMQVLTAGMEAWKPVLVEALREAVPCRLIYEKSDTAFREIEGLERREGALWGEGGNFMVDVRENGFIFHVDVKAGQKTGFFLDQRENRLLVKRMAAGRKVLNCFSYTGGFSVYAAAGGAAGVVSVDSSEPALDLANQNMVDNGFNAVHVCQRGDVFEYLRQSSGEPDFIILDPPAFCRNRQQVEKACRGYKDINLAAFRRLPAGGLLLTASCSSYITPELFQKVIFAAAKDAGRRVRILSKTSHAPDHPVSVYHPEGEYLKAFLCHVI